jgi:AraC-like DNA-binding protein
MDPLSDVLSLLKPRSYIAGGIDHGGQWSVAFPRHEGIKCYAVVSGTCWLCVEGIDDPMRLGPGECFLLPRGRPFRLCSDPALPPVSYKTILRTPLRGNVATVNGGGDCLIAGGHFLLAGHHADMLMKVLPPVVHLRKEADRRALRWALERMQEELREQRPGGYLVAQQLAYTMLVQALRLHLAEGPKGGVGWLFALADPRMCAAITAIHEDPAHAWTLQELAERATMSRSSFALRFKETVGTSPMEYLTQWRMALAGDRLANTRDSISAVAQSLGYESGNAFSTAFKRVMGMSPRRYVRARHPLAQAG